MKYIVANWKMNLPESVKPGTTQSDGIENYLEIIIQGLKQQIKSELQVELWQHFIIAPPAVFFYPLKNIMQNLVQESGGSFSLAAQDVSAMPKGAWTGQISASMLKLAGVQYSLVGHSERRKKLIDGGMQETGELLQQKICQLWQANLIPIFCIGEDLAAKQLGQTLQFLEEQLTKVLQPLRSVLTNYQKPNLWLAYEPIWAIGTGQLPSAAEIEQCHGFIRTRVEQLLGKLDATSYVFYGGSVNSQYAENLLNLKQVDGLLVGNASLKPEEMLAMLALLLKKAL